jgi:hypothetical protein
MFVVRPGEPFETDVLRVADYAAYYRMVKRRFEQDFQKGLNPNSYPVPNPHCQVCDWWRSCNKIWRDDDHLTYVAGMGKVQIAELEIHSVATLAESATTFSGIDCWRVSSARTLTLPWYGVRRGAPAGWQSLPWNNRARTP